MPIAASATRGRVDRFPGHVISGLLIEVADVAIAAEIGGQRAGQRRFALGIAGQEPLPGVAGHRHVRIGRLDRRLDLADQRAGELHRLHQRQRPQTVGEIGIARRQRIPDGHGIVVRRQFLQLIGGDRIRVGLARSQHRRLPAMRQYRRRRADQRHRQQHRRRLACRPCGR